MKILLKKLTLTNFKGVRQFIIVGGRVLDIYGDNATGKTSLLDSYLWLLFGKDSTDRKDFEIKTLDENNKPYRKLTHEVEGVLDVDGNEITLRRCFKEKWQTIKGTAKDEFKGHETSYFWNDVPLKLEEYQAKVSSIIDEKVFKLISNITYFNSLKWQDRRAVLMQIGGKISDKDVIDKIATLHNKTEIGILCNELNAGKSIEEFKKQLAAQRKKIKDELDLMPARIQEAKRALPEKRDYEEIYGRVNQLNLEISDVDSLLNNKSLAYKQHQEAITELIKKKQTLNQALLDIQFGINNKVQEKKRERESKILAEKSELRRLQDELAVARRDYKTADDKKNQLVKEQADLRQQWGTLDAETLEFKEGQFCCPTCKREYEASDVEAAKAKLTANFNTTKSTRLKEITDRGQAIGVEIADLDTRMTNLKAKGESLNQDIAIVTNRLTELETEHARLSTDDAAEAEKLLASDSAYQQHKKDIELLDEQINAPYTAEDNSALIQRKGSLTTQLDQAKTELAGKEQREKQLARIEELTKQEEAMAQQLANFEGAEFTIEQFTKAKMDMLEERINGRFKIVRFKMFEDQINGGQSEACTTLINGVPYSDANTAAKVQAGLDIINVLNDHYGVYAPVWVDNRESIVSLPETKSQIINLHVVEGAQLSVGEIKWKPGYEPKQKEVMA